MLKLNRETTKAILHSITQQNAYERKDTKITERDKI